jgi:hypothetical protein
MAGKLESPGHLLTKPSSASSRSTHPTDEKKLVWQRPKVSKTNYITRLQGDEP